MFCFPHNNSPHFSVAAPHAWRRTHTSAHAHAFSSQFHGTYLLSEPIRAVWTGLRAACLLNGGQNRGVSACLWQSSCTLLCTTLNMLEKITEGLEEGGQHKESWMWETQRKLEAGRKLKGTDGDKYKQVERRRRRREESGQKKWMVAVRERKLRLLDYDAFKHI